MKLWSWFLSTNWKPVLRNSHSQSGGSPWIGRAVFRVTDLVVRNRWPKLTLSTFEKNIQSLSCLVSKCESQCVFVNIYECLRTIASAYECLWVIVSVCECLLVFVSVWMIVSVGCVFMSSLHLCFVFVFQRCLFCIHVLHFCFAFMGFIYVLHLCFVIVFYIRVLCLCFAFVFPPFCICILCCVCIFILCLHSRFALTFYRYSLHLHLCLCCQRTHAVRARACVWECVIYVSVFCVCLVVFLILFKLFLMYCSSHLYFVWVHIWTTATSLTPTQLCVCIRACVRACLMCVDVLLFFIIAFLFPCRSSEWSTHVHWTVSDALFVWMWDWRECVCLIRTYVICVFVLV